MESVKRNVAHALLHNAANSSQYGECRGSCGADPLVCAGRLVPPHLHQWWGGPPGPRPTPPSACSRLLWLRVFFAILPPWRETSSARQAAVLVNYTESWSSFRTSP